MKTSRSMLAALAAAVLCVTCAVFTLRGGAPLRAPRTGTTEELRSSAATTDRGLSRGAARSTPERAAMAAPAERTDDDTPEEERGYIPAAEVRKPPEPMLAAPPRVTPPPDPATHTPPQDNPGGVDGDRPPREEPR